MINLANNTQTAEVNKPFWRNPVLIFGLATLLLVMIFALFRYMNRERETRGGSVQVNDTVFAPATPKPQNSTTNNQITNQEKLNWYTCKNIGVKVLKPESWSAEEKEEANGSVCYLTREENGGTKGFTTGLTIEVNKDTTAQFDISAQERALSWLQGADKAFEAGSLSSLGEIQTIKMPEPFVAYARTATINNHHFYYLNVANTKTDTLLLIVFEGADNTWKNDWERIGKEMTSQLKLNENL